MASEIDVYEKLTDRLGAPGSQRFIKVLKAMVTPEEARILLELPKPMTCADLAKKLNVDEKTLQAQLDAIKEKGLINLGEQGYVSHNNIVMFHHSAQALIPAELKPSIYPLWEDFFFNEWRDILMDGFEARLAKIGAKGHRVFPASKALRASPDIPRDQILWYEDMEQMIERGKSIISTDCGCRVIWRKCDKPIHI
jgi:DNA-binding transcriptional ArsR family regulator